MKQENNSLNIEKFLITFLSFLYQYDDYEVNIDINTLKQYIKECKNNNKYNSLLKIFNEEIEKNIDIEIKSLEAKQLLKEINKDLNIYKIPYTISKIEINYKDISCFVQEMIEFVEDYYETYLNEEYEEINIKNRHYEK